MARRRIASLLTVLSLTAGFVGYACSPSAPAGAQATKPLSPADGAKDYDQSFGPPGPADPTPIGSGPGVGARPLPPEQPSGNCPPRCAPDGTWRGCGLRSPRGGSCAGCTPRCLGKGTPDEGWYDCEGVLIVRRACGG